METRRTELFGVLWTELGRTGRFALAGLLAAVAVTLALGSFLPAEIRHHLVRAEGRGLLVAVEAIERELPPLADRSSLTAAERTAIDGLVRRSLLGGDRVRVKLWTLDGTVLYSDEASLVGRSFGDAVGRIEAARQDLVAADITNLGEPEHASEGAFPRLVEYYVAVRDPASREVVAVIESYQDVSFFVQAVGSIEFAIWLSISVAIALLVTFLVSLMVVTLRSIQRERAAAAEYAREVELLAATAESLASSFDPSRLTAAVANGVSSALGLTRIEVIPPGPPVDGEVVSELRDGSRVVVERPGKALTHSELRILRAAVHVLDAARSNAQLYSDVRDAALDPGELAARLERIRDEERHKLVRDLHDSLAGELVRTLYAVRRLEAGRTELDADLRRGLEELERLVLSSEELLRAFMGGMVAVAEDAGTLSDTLDALADSVQRETGMSIHRRYVGDLDDVPGEIQLTVLRVANEALLNVQKHAAAGVVKLTVRRDRDALVLTVDDDGQGWLEVRDARHGRGLGLGYLQDRVADLNGSVRMGRSRLGGARLAIRLPIRA